MDNEANCQVESISKLREVTMHLEKDDRELNEA